MTVSPGRAIGVGFRRWKAANLAPMMSLWPERVSFSRDAEAAARARPGVGDALFFWGGTPPAGLSELAQRSGARLVRVFDATQPSTLDQYLHN